MYEFDTQPMLLKFPRATSVVLHVAMWLHQVSVRYDEPFYHPPTLSCPLLFSAPPVLPLPGTWRVGGVLAVSRAFGDKLHKRYVVAEPEIEVGERERGREGGGRTLGACVCRTVLSPPILYHCF